MKSSFSLTDAPIELPIAVSSKQVRDVLKSELSTSVPVATPVIAVGTSGNQIGLLHSKEGERHLPTSAEAVQSHEDPKTGNWTEQNINPLTTTSSFCSMYDHWYLSQPRLRSLL